MSTKSALERTRRADAARRRRRLLAVLSGGLALGVGSTLTQATWTDTEWVFGGVGLTNGVGTSSFAVNQNTTSPFDGTGPNWVDRPSDPGGALTFSTGNLTLAPGSTTYAPIALRTAADSVAGTVLLQPAVQADGISAVDDGDHLWSALRLRVAVSTTSVTCDLAAFSAPGATVIVDGTLDDGAALVDSQLLSAGSGSTAHYCFEISLPDIPEVADHSPSLQGRAVAPAWQWTAVSQ